MRKRTAFIFGIVGLMAVAILAALLLAKRSQLQSGISGGEQITIELASPGLTWNNKRSLENIFKELIGQAQNNLSNNFDKQIKKVVIKKVDERRTQLITYTGGLKDENHVASGSYAFNGDTLYIDVYLRHTDKAIPVLRDALFMEKVVTIFMLAAPPPIGSGRTVSQEGWSIYDYYEDIENRYFSVENKDKKTGEYPIHVQ